ncbi:MAG: DUF5050 domain-containing protein [Syntrophaceae bacterium]|nr:DUF5050 domain-containing protein [Syntrophaceae bacterium]
MRYFIGFLLIFVLCCPAFSRQFQKPGFVPAKPGAPMQADTSTPRSVSLDKKSLYLLVGGTPAKLMATVLPAEALNKNVRWESTNVKVATVDNTGKVTPVGAGTCQVLVYTQEGGYRDACDVMVDFMNTVGNTPGNSLNGGYLARQGNWVYYANPYDGMKLYKSRLLGPKDRIKLSNDKVSGINVVGDWVYYINHSQSHNLFKIRIDGTGEKRISDIDKLYRPATSGFENVHVIDDRIYYMGGGAYLRSIKVNGMDRKMLFNEINIKFFTPCGEWFYYSKLNDDGLYRIRKDGTGKTKVWDAPVGSFSVDGDFVYVTNEENAIIRIAPDRGRLFYAKNINASNSWIYWSTLASDIMKMRNDFKLSDTLVSFEGKDRKDIKIFVTDDWIFYYTFGKWGVPDGLFMVRTDGIGHQEFR